MDENPIQPPVQPPTQPPTPTKPSFKFPLILAIVIGLIVGGYFVGAHYLKIWLYQAATSPEKSELFYPDKDKIILFKSCTPEDIQNNRGVCIKGDGLYLIEFPSQKTTKILERKVPFSIRDLKIFDNNIAWIENKTGRLTNGTNGMLVDYDESDWNVYYLNLENRQENKVTSYSTKRDNLRIYNNIIVWTEEDPNNYRNKAIYAYDLATNQEIFKDTTTGNKEGLSLYGNLLVWADGRKCENCSGNPLYGNPYVDIFAYIYVYDFSKKEQRILVESPYSKSSPSLYGNKLVWADYRKDYPGTYLMDINTQEQNLIINGELAGYDPQIYKDKIIWTIRSSCDVMPQSPDYTGVYLYDLQTKQTERLTDYVEPRANLYDGMVVIKEPCWISGSEYGVSTN